MPGLVTQTRLLQLEVKLREYAHEMTMFSTTKKVKLPDFEQQQKGEERKQGIWTLTGVQTPANGRLQARVLSRL